MAPIPAADMRSRRKAHGGRRRKRSAVETPHPGSSAKTFELWMRLSKMALRHDLIGSPALAGVAWKDLIGSSALAGVAWKDFIATAHVTAIGVIVTTTHAMMIDVIVTVTVHVVAIIMMAVALHVVVTAVVPGNASTSSMCLCRGCSAGDQKYCPQASQKFPGFDHRAPSRVAT